MKKTLIFIYFGILVISSFNRFLGQYFVSAIESNSSYISFLCDIGIVAIGILSISRFNAYLKILLALLVCSIFTLIINEAHITYQAHLNGLRSYLVLFFSLSFFNEIIDSKYWYYFHKLFIKVLIVVLTFHGITAMYEFSLHGACDEVGGGMAFGGSGILTLIIFASTFFLILDASRIHNFQKIVFAKVWPYYLLLLPVFINETKITFILLPVFILFQLRYTLSNVHNLILIGFGMVIIIMLYSSFYGIISTSQEENVQNPIEDFTRMEFLQGYLMNDNLSTYNISRATKLIIGFELLRADIMNFLFGFGIGIFKGFDLLGVTSFTRNYEWIIRGTNTELFMLLFQTGIIGSIVYLFGVFFSFRRTDPPSIIKHLVYNRFKIFLLILILLSLFYNTALSEGPFVLLLSYYLVYIAKFKLYNEKRLSFVEDSNY